MKCYLVSTIDIDYLGWVNGSNRFWRYNSDAANPTTCAQAEALFLALSPEQKVAQCSTTIPEADSNYAWFLRGCSGGSTPTDPTNPTTPTTPGSSLLSEIGKTPVLKQMRYRVVQNSTRAVELELLPAANWKYKAQNTRGDFQSQVSNDWNTITALDVPANGVVSVVAPADTNNNFTLVRVISTTTDEFYDVTIRAYETSDWRIIGGNNVLIEERNDFKSLFTTDSTRLNLIADHYDDDYVYVKDTSGFARGNDKAWWWTVNGCDAKIPDNNPLGLLKLPRDCYIAIYRDEVPAGSTRHTNEGYTRAFPVVNIQNSDSVQIYTGKP